VCQTRSHAPVGWYLTLRRDNVHIQTKLTGDTLPRDDAGVSNTILCQGRAAPPEICLGSDVQRKILVHRGTHVIQIRKVSFPIVFRNANWSIKFNHKNNEILHIYHNYRLPIFLPL
jgi:hypothetical protein